MKKIIQRKIVVLILCVSFVAGVFLYVVQGKVVFLDNKNDHENQKNVVDEFIDKGDFNTLEQGHPLAIETLRNREYEGGTFVIEEKLADGSNFYRYIVSYQSEGLKIYGLLTVPMSEKPENGYPAVLFVHGYIPPDQYSTVDSYPTYQYYLARSGFVTFKPDLRGHGESEGEPVSAHYSEKYVVDTMYALSYMKNFEEIDPARIGYWGHSNGGEIGLRVVLISSDIQAASFWAGVVGRYETMFETLRNDISFLRGVEETELVKKYGLPSGNKEFWNMLEPYQYISDIDIPIQVQHATGDKSVPVALSRELVEVLELNGKRVEYIEYVGDDHNISGNVHSAWRATIEFFEHEL